MTITGSYEFSRKGSWQLRPSTITVFLHEMIETKGLGPSDAESLRARVHAIVARPVDEALGLAAPAAELQAYHHAHGREDVRVDAARTVSTLSQLDGVLG